MKPTFLMLTLLALCGSAGAATPNSAPVRLASLPPGDRFLFLVDASAGMSKLGYASRQAVFDLIWSGLGGHMRAGDTFGVWTFSDEPHPGKLPMQIWNTNSLEQASLVGRFLRDQPYEKRADLGKAVSTANVVAQRVKDLTVFIITDGSSRITGTPFDDAINELFKQRTSSARQNKRPLITTLVARGGDFMRWSVTWPNEEILMPERVSKPIVARPSTNAAPAAAPRLAARAPVAPIIITNSRPPKPSSEIASAAAPIVFTAGSGSPATGAVAVTRASVEGPRAGGPAHSNLLSAATNTTAECDRPPAQTAAPPVTLRMDRSALVEAPSRPSGPVTDAVAEVTTPKSAAPLLASQLLAPIRVAARETLPPSPTSVAPGGGQFAVGPATGSRPPSLNPVLMLSIGTALLLSAAMAAVFFLKRIRQASQPSIISESMGHDPRKVGVRQ
jgi:hypothetical protein